MSDSENLLAYKNEKQLSDDLIYEFTSNDSGDEVVQQGIMIALAGIDNLPYTILIKTENEPSELAKEPHCLVHHQSGYILHVVNNKIALFTMPYLRCFTQASIDNIEQFKPVKIRLINGWYNVAVYMGFLKGNEGDEPCLEFILKKEAEQPQFYADVQYMYQLGN